MFSFILCVGVLRERGEINDEAWHFFLVTQTANAAATGGAATGALKMKKEKDDKAGKQLLWHYLSFDKM